MHAAKKQKLPEVQSPEDDLLFFMRLPSAERVIFFLVAFANFI